MYMRKTKIVCTLGPATDDESVLTQMIESGMDIARLNFSHGDYPDHKMRMDELKRVREKLGSFVALLLDTKGPEIRIGTFKQGKITILDGQDFTLTTDEVDGDETIVSISYKTLPQEVGRGNRIMIDDGLIELEVLNVTNTQIHCRVVNGGKVSNRKGINVPGVTLNMPYLSEKDRKDIIFGIQNDVDYIAASFVRNAFDVLEVRKVLEQNNGTNIHIIAKIENNDGVKNIDEILKVCDGIMVARGDMGVEIPIEDLPRVQKMLISKCYKAGKKVITATQMLESMIEKPRPTRAEVTDVANSVYDGTSAMMLSGETAVGKHPVEAVRTMARIAEKAEAAIDYKTNFKKSDLSSTSVTNAISHATCMTAHDLEAAAIITVSKSGHTARMVSKYRPSCPIIAATVDEKVARQLSLSWGVVPIITEYKENSDDLFEHAVEESIKTGLVKNGDLVVLTGGVPLGVSGTTNILKVHLVGHVLCQGVGANHLFASGTLCVAKSEDEAIRTFNQGDILVIKETSNNILDILKKCSGIITEGSGLTSHAAIVGMTLGIPVITDAKNATQLLKSGVVVTIDGTRGQVYSGIAKVL